MADFTETLGLPDRFVLQASADRFRLRRLAPWDATCADDLPAQGDVATTRQLMVGALYAATPKQPPDSPPRDTLLSYVHRLATTYITTGSTPSAERRAAERLAARGQAAAAAYRLHVAEEEAGHDVLAMKDVAALGLPPEAFFARLRPSRALALVERQQAIAASDEPIAITGYAYVLERLALFSTAQSVEDIERVLPPGVRATRCLRVHSAVGSDIGHVDEALAFIAGLPARDRAIVAREVYQTSQLAHRADDYPGDAAMRDLLRDLDWPYLHAAA